MSLHKLELFFKKTESNITKDFTEKQKRLFDVLIFLLKFLILALPMYLIIWSGIEFTSIIRLTSYAVAVVLSFFTGSFSYDGSLFILNTLTGELGVEIIKDCIGWKSFLALVGLIFATRKVKLKPRLLGVLIGIPVIFIGNVIRLVTTMYFTIIYGISFFDIIHSFLWEWGLVLFVLALWIVWLKKIAFNVKFL
ncbi:MAG: exosortase/archaeosortase family protein [DPANN group archaeon]|nr:exosortase/archaeosortase family protein [DPANN group archaeon]